MTTKTTILEFPTSIGGVDITYCIVNPDFEAEERQTRDHPGCPAWVGFEAVYVKGDPNEANLFPNAEAPKLTHATIDSYQLYQEVMNFLYEHFVEAVMSGEADYSDYEYDSRRDRELGI